MPLLNATVMEAKLDPPGAIRTLELQPQAKLQAASVILRINIRGFSKLTAGYTHIWIVVIHIVQSIKCVHVQLEFNPLGNSEVLVERAVDVEVLRPSDVGVIPRVRAPGKGG